MCKEKLRGQFIFSTQNSYISVLRDADLIFELSTLVRSEYNGEQNREEHLDSLYDVAVLLLVEQILEVYKDAFEWRRKKYGF